jgi:hypothetical protein
VCLPIVLLTLTRNIHVVEEPADEVEGHDNEIEELVEEERRFESSPLLN